MSDWKNVQYENGKYRTSEGGGGGGSSTFAGLDDVSFSNLQNGQVPKYNSTTQKWENANESGGGGTVTDVEVDGVSVVNQQGVAEITMPTPPTIPVTDVKVNGTSVVDGNKEAQIKSYKEVTQAEYNALPDSKLNDGILYAIKDSAGADGFPPLIYSDEEREVGVWKNGKPLYQRTFTVTLNANERRDIDSNIDFCFLVGNSYITSNQVLSEQYIDSAVQIYCYVDTYLENGIWTMRIQNMFSSQLTYCVTVRYTKTTDTAGSGTWTTQGGYAHHYSTTEHVIGTWIDGKPLYERTYILNSLSNSVTTLDANASVDTLVSVYGRASDGQRQYQIPYSFGNESIRIIADDNGTWTTAHGLVVHASSSIFSSGAYIVVRYTKTTD